MTTSRSRLIARLPYPAFLIGLLVFAAVTRFRQFGNPIVQLDEQFYLLVGDRMLSGAIPYVDIWDRKPAGLFAIFAAIRELGGSGIVQYQLVAAAFAIATAVIIERLGSRISGARGSRLAALLYLCWIPLLGGEGGQAPIFYNLFMAAAALLLCVAAESRHSTTRLLVIGGSAMLAVGVAMQIKYTAIFEGISFGLALTYLARQRRMRTPLVLTLAVLWIGIALVPTALAAIYYLEIGKFGEFWFANFASIFLRNSLGLEKTLQNAAILLVGLAGPILLGARGAKLRLTADRSFVSKFMALWLATAIAAVAIFGYYYDHYGLPVLVPAAVCSAAAFDRKDVGKWPLLVLMAGLIACLALPTFNQHRRGTPAQFDRLKHEIEPYAAGGILVWDNLPILYYVFRTKLPSRYYFPTHLRNANERGAVGTDEMLELRRILDDRPAVIIVEKDKPVTIGQPTTTYLLKRIAAEYRQIASIKVGRRLQLIYLANHIPRSPRSGTHEIGSRH